MRSRLNLFLEKEKWRDTCGRGRVFYGRELSLVHTEKERRWVKCSVRQDEHFFFFQPPSSLGFPISSSKPPHSPSSSSSAAELGKVMFQVFEPKRRRKGFYTRQLYNRLNMFAKRRGLKVLPKIRTGETNTQVEKYGDWGLFAPLCKRKQHDWCNWSMRAKKGPSVCFFLTPPVIKNQLRREEKEEEGLGFAFGKALSKSCWKREE